VNIVELGLVYEVEIKHLDEGKREIDVKMTLTAPAAAWARSWSTTCAASSK
jgi:metal-sulfur cluster biosynthetic enzyme